MHPNSGWSEKGKAQSQGLGERPHFTGQEEAIHKRQEHSANAGDPAYHRHMHPCVGWINTKLFFFFLAAPRSLQDLSSSTRDQTLGSGSESAEC